MSALGWRGRLTMWREATLQGSKTGNALAVPGIVDARLSRQNKAGLVKTNPHGATTESAPLHATYRLDIQREFSLNAFSTMVAEALRTDPATVLTDTPTAGLTSTTRPTRTDAATPTFGVDFISGDGQARRLTGCTPDRIEWQWNSRRILMQTISFPVLGNDALDPEDFTAPDVVLSHVQLSGLNVLHYIAGDKATSFTSQVIVDREIEAVQFTESGRPTRWQPMNGWQAAGQSTVRLSPTAAAGHGFDIASARQAQEWRIEDRTGRRFTILFPATRIQRRGTPIINGDFIDHGLEWVSTQDNAATFQTTTIEP